MLGLSVQIQLYFAFTLGHFRVSLVTMNFFSSLHKNWDTKYFKPVQCQAGVDMCHVFGDHIMQIRFHSLLFFSLAV